MEKNVRIVTRKIYLKQGCCNKYSGKENLENLLKDSRVHYIRMWAGEILSLALIFTSSQGKPETVMDCQMLAAALKGPLPRLEKQPFLT